MEIFKVIIHTHGGDRYIDNVVNYILDGRQERAKGYGVNPYDPDIAAMQMKRTARYFNNQNKTPLFHYVTSYSPETAPTPEKALELTDKVFSNITDSHQALIGIHSEKQAKSLNHAHTVVNPTDFNTGKMMYGDNSTNYSIAQRMADVTGQPTKLIVRKEDETEWECLRVFVPHDSAAD
ncbi:relaxase/mobilization nuclease domain-containing protein [Ruminococcus flavefaciens]|uniref:relaxase/mobilization nuclease domain-containing protein n=1 Tax=Ruminococcus flavefaciens TaxID=1265 RepID=UPI0026EA2716|nr:relaxase/mobilization nuclease domain-containing protein [Ruminococcus flavefaciens]